MEITDFEKELLEVIMNNTPFTYIEVFRVYAKTNKSIDKTIFALIKSIQLGLLPTELCE